MTASATPAIALLVRAGTAHEVHEYSAAERHGTARHDRPDFGEEAAAALGVEPARMGKTLIVSVDGELIAAVVPVDRRLDLKALAAVVGHRHAALAEPAAAERATGSVVGGISPLGMRRRLRVVVDAGLLEYPTILVSGGRRGLQVELAPGALVAVVSASIGAISRSA